MTRVLAAPSNLDEHAFEAFLAEVDQLQGERPLFDLRHLRFGDPFGMLGLLSLGEELTSRGTRPLLQLPESPEVASYFSRMGFYRHAAEVFEAHGDVPPERKMGPSPVLLEITPIRSHEDVHGVMDRLLQSRVTEILETSLGYARGDAMGFGMLLSEVCQNIIEHADTTGWVAIQIYDRKKTVGRKVAEIAVMDRGVGFRGSLHPTHSARFGDRWSDAAALEAAFLHGMTRFRDPGRGQGLKQIRRQVGRWGGKISIRSGSACISDVPEWDDAQPLTTGLPFFPGSQILIVMPARAGHAARETS
jgi:anti-sigma regulatory factor (Ser/Thr protein kinase)